MNSKNIEDIYPLSPMQEGILFHSIYSQDAGVYFNQMIYSLEGDLEVGAFRQAWQSVVDRHQILRTAFVWKGQEKPLQVIRASAKVSIQLHDWREVKPADFNAKFEDLLNTDRRKGFALSEAPLMRINLVQNNINDYDLIWSCHGLILDGWSLPLVIKEFLQNYDAIIQGEELERDSPNTYKDYITWLGKQNRSDARNYWRGALKGYSTPTPIGFDKAPGVPMNLDGNFGQVEMRLSSELSKSLDSFARTHQMTQYTLMQATWAILLSRYSGEKDVTFGATSSGRPAELLGIDSTVGVFINTLPLRTSVSPHETILSYLKGLHKQHTEIRQYEYSRLINVQEWSDVPRGTPLFESILVFSNYPMDTPFLEEIESSIKLSNFRSSESTNYPITIMVIPGDQWLVRIYFHENRFDSSHTELMLGHIQSILGQLIQIPNQPVATLSVLTSSETDQMLGEWNDTQVKFPKDNLIHKLFQDQAIARPSALAVSFGDDHLTYDDLNTRANQLAHHLREKGVGPEVIVAIYTERSVEMVIGMLAVLKAGGAYLPLDPIYPEDRLDFMLRDSGATVILTQEHLLGTIPEQDSHVISLDSDWEVVAREPGTNLVSEVHAENLAYLIYTSGSTGQPKGVAIPHKGLLSLVYWHLKAFGISPDDRATQIATSAFDASVWEIWPYLAAGASLHLATTERMASAEVLRDWLIEDNITISFVPTPLTGELIKLDWPKKVDLRILLTGGDKLNSYPPKTLPFKLFNNYGPTENSVVATSGITLPGNALEISPPIGRAIDNTQTFILDEYLHPVPIGIPGELHLSGESLARGYLDRPGLTAEKFTPHPFSDKPGARIYKTGDLARYLPDGNIEFLGRNDYQVKIRGYRIEIGEIETVLGQHSSIIQNVVTTQEDERGEKSLVAYVVPVLGVIPEISSLRNHLSRKLPGYMVPAHFVILDEIPITPSGKVNLAELPKPIREDLVDESDLIPPRDEIEIQLVRIWERILGVTPVGLNSDFFELGGHSLVAMRLFVQIEKMFQIKLPLATLFNASTVADQVKILKDQVDNLDWSSLIVVQPEGSKPPLFCMAAKGGNTLTYRHLALRMKKDRPVYLLQSRGLSGNVNPYLTMNEIAKDFIAEIRNVQPEGPYHLCGSSFGGIVAYEIAHQLLADGEEIGLLGLFDTFSPLHPGYLPNINRLIIKVYGVTDYLAKHIANLRISNWKQRADYVRRYIGLSWKLIKISTAKLIKKIKDAIAQPMPEELKRVEIANLKAAAEYLPPSYPGKLTLFRATVRPKGLYEDETLGWGDLDVGEIELRDIPGHHGSILYEPRVSILADLLEECLETADNDSHIVHASAGAQPIPLTAIQSWFFSQNFKDPHHFNMPIMLDIPKDLDFQALELALQTIVSHHDALRYEYSIEGDYIVQRASGQSKRLSIEHFDLSGLTKSAQRMAIEESTSKLQASLNFSQGPLIRVAVFQMGIHTTAHLFICIHHLVIDAVSWGIFLDDLQTVYMQLTEGEVIHLPSKTTSFSRWSKRLQEYAQSAELQDELTFWSDILDTGGTVMPVDHAGGKNTVGSTRIVDVILDKIETQTLLREMPRLHKVQINDVLLAVLSRVLPKWAQSEFILLDVEGHGREQIVDGVDLSHTIGWFTTMYPILLKSNNSDDLGSSLWDMKDQLLQIPNKGIGYGLLQQLSKNPKASELLSAHTEREVSYQFLGRLDRDPEESALFRRTQDDVGFAASPRDHRTHKLVITGYVMDGHFYMEWMYSKNIHNRNTIEKLAEKFILELRGMLASSAMPTAKVPEDLPSLGSD